VVGENPLNRNERLLRNKDDDIVWACMENMQKFILDNYRNNNYSIENW